MLAPLSGWTRQLRGGSTLLVPPDGPETGHLRYRERVRPLRGVRELVREAMTAFPAFEGGEPQVEPLVTLEGEYAAIARVEGTLEGKPAQRDFGFVFGDDFYTRLLGLCVKPERFAAFSDAVRRLTLADSQLLGIRRRRYLYEPPPRDHWQGIARVFQTDWIPLDFPRNGSVITVFPANPVPASPAQVAENLFAEDKALGFRVDRQEGPETLQTQFGLFGGKWELEGQHLGRPVTLRQLVVLQDRRYLYSLLLDSATPDTRDAAIATFDKLVRSVRPLPEATSLVPRDESGAMAHWL
jgi:hypothetical protein